MAIYRVLVNNAPFTCVLIFSDSQAAIIFLSGFVNNCRIVSECRRCLDLISGRLTSVSLVKFAIALKFFRDAYLFWVDVESCSVAGLIWPLMDRRRKN